MKVYIRPLNICHMRRVNVFQYKEALKLAGHQIVDSPEDADKILVWTCAFRGDFHDNSTAVLKQFEDKDYQVVAAGCLPSIDPDFINQQFHGQVIHFNNDDKEFNQVFGCMLKNTNYPVAEAPITIRLEEYRLQHPMTKVAWDDQYIKLFISEGCTRRCTYCTEVLAFPPYQSYPPDKIITKAQELVERTGVKKIALFADDLGAYGIDINHSLVKLITRLIDIDPEVQISLKQIHPLWWKVYFNELKPLIDTRRIFQLLVPIQSANTRILGLMKRGYTYDDLDFLFNSVKNTNLELETHIIAGFPTETEQEWEDTVQFVCKYRFRYVMGNLFMAGLGTEAKEMPEQVKEDEKERRMAIGAREIEKHGTVISYNLDWRAREHITHTRVNFMEL